MVCLLLVMINSLVWFSFYFIKILLRQLFFQQIKTLVISSYSLALVPWLDLWTLLFISTFQASLGEVVMTLCWTFTF